jgi:hypothetical protein
MLLSVTMHASEPSSYKASAVEQVAVPFDKSAALVVLPAVGGGRLQDPSLRRWLARSDIRQLAGPRELLSRILEVLGMPYPASGLGALRMWGQTGDRPTVWIAAADPAYLEPRLDHLCLHAHDEQAAPVADLRPLVDHVQSVLGTDEGYGFARLGNYCYLRAATSITTAAIPAYVVHRDMPNEYMPQGEDADGYRKLVSEVEMALHDHEVNERRYSEGKQPINCLWFWGGGTAPEQETAPHPPLFANDPLLVGYWMSKTGVVANWPGDIPSCVAASVAGFVAIVPEKEDEQLLTQCLRDLRQLLAEGRLSSLTLMFADGIEATVLPGHRRRLWRRECPLLD